MTEEEARDKWCPHVRQAEHFGDNTVSVNTGHEISNCITSNCMMWVAMPKSESGLESKGHCGLSK